MMRYLGYWIVPCLLAVYSSSAFAVILPFDSVELEIAGEGCVGGYTNKGIRAAYYRSTTSQLNKQLALIKQRESEYKRIEIVVNAGPGSVMHPIDRQASSANEPAASSISVNWVTYEFDSKILWYMPDQGFAPSTSFKLFSEPIVPFRSPAAKSIRFQVWISGDLKIHELEIPPGIAVKSGEEIERIEEFVASIERRQ